MWLIWLITSIPNPRVLKIEKIKNKSKENKNEKENKKKQSPLSTILTKNIVWSISFHNELNIRNLISKDKSKDECLLERIESIIVEGVKLPKDILLGKMC